MTLIWSHRSSDGGVIISCMSIKEFLSMLSLAWVACARGNWEVTLLKKHMWPEMCIAAFVNYFWHAAYDSIIIWFIRSEGSECAGARIAAYLSVNYHINFKGSRSRQMASKFSSQTVADTFFSYRVNTLPICVARKGLCGIRATSNISKLLPTKLFMHVRAIKAELKHIMVSHYRIIVKNRI